MNNILVIGSLNADLMVQVNELPVPGETVSSKSFEVLPGGKGMNQAICAAKLGANVTMAGCVGTDEYARILFEALNQSQVNSEYIRIESDAPTGIAIVTTSHKDNNIVVVPGANALVDSNYIDSIRHVIRESDMVILQLEIPLETVYYTIDVCREEGVPVLLNPAPARNINPDYIEKVAYLIPNETELVSIFKEDYETTLAKYPNKIIMSAGEHGAYYHDGNGIVNLEARKIQVVDTTGAGDAFNGAFAVAILQGKELKDAIAFANGIAAITTTVKGAQGADADKYKENV